jgi:hypothetical protein
MKATCEIARATQHKLLEPVSLQRQAHWLVPCLGASWLLRQARTTAALVALASAQSRALLALGLKAKPTNETLFDAALQGVGTTYCNKKELL